MTVCSECSIPYETKNAEEIALTDGLGNFYIGVLCPNCREIVKRQYPTNLPDAIRKQATRDPNPPPRSEMG